VRHFADFKTGAAEFPIFHGPPLRDVKLFWIVAVTGTEINLREASGFAII